MGSSSMGGDSNFKFLRDGEMIEIDQDDLPAKMYGDWFEVCKDGKSNKEELPEEIRDAIESKKRKEPEEDFPFEFPESLCDEMKQKMEFEPVYAGCTIKINWKVPYYISQIRHDGKILKKTFSVTNCPDVSPESFKPMAEAWRREISDKLGLTKYRPITPKNQPIIDYAALFFDGDGSIAFKDGIMIRIAQSQENGTAIVLKYLHFYFGGNIYLSKKDPNPKRRRSSMLTLDAEDAKNFVSACTSSSIVKKPQLIVARDFLDLKNPTEKQKEDCKTQLSALKNQYGSVKVKSEDLNLPKLAGLFDAEGCVLVEESGTLCVTITQKCCPSLLFAIQSYLGFGSVGLVSIRWTANADNAVKFLKMIQCFAIQKTDQIQIALQAALLPNKERKEHRSLLQKLKRK